ncbi:hypothetical protein KVQ30_27465, partial [Klebsiella pneumoniae]|nr:hypothetical protein [Klebsiella pneumoniae]
FGGGGNLIEGLYSEGHDFIQNNIGKFHKEVGGQAVLGRQGSLTTPWLTERHGYDPTFFGGGGNLIEGLYSEGHDFIQNNIGKFHK